MRTSETPHQSADPDLDACLQRRLREQIAINLEIAVPAEDRLAPVPTLRNMVNKSRNHDPRQTCPPISLTILAEAGDVRRIIWLM
jgi:hypothetical protein